MQVNLKNVFDDIVKKNIFVNLTNSFCDTLIVEKNLKNNKYIANIYSQENIYDIMESISEEGCVLITYICDVKSVEYIEEVSNFIKQIFNKYNYEIKIIYTTIFQFKFTIVIVINDLTDDFINNWKIKMEMEKFINDKDDLSYNSKENNVDSESEVVSAKNGDKSEEDLSDDSENLEVVSVKDDNKSEDDLSDSDNDSIDDSENPEVVSAEDDNKSEDDLSDSDNDSINDLENPEVVSAKNGDKSEEDLSDSDNDLSDDSESVEVVSEDNDDSEDEEDVESVEVVSEMSDNSESED